MLIFIQRYLWSFERLFYEGMKEYEIKILGTHRFYASFFTHAKDEDKIGTEDPMVLYNSLLLETIGQRKHWLIVPDEGFKSIFATYGHRGHLGMMLAFNRNTYRPVKLYGNPKQIAT